MIDWLKNIQAWDGWVTLVAWLKNVQAWDMAGWVTALAAFIALLFGIFQVRSARKTQREATANEIWMNYEQRGLEYPRNANPELSAFDYEKRTLNGKRQKFYEYEWFVSFMLLACDAVLLLNSRGWKDVVKTNLEYHEKYLTSNIFDKE